LRWRRGCLRRGSALRSELERSCRKRASVRSLCRPHFPAASEAGRGNLSRPTEPSEGLAHCVSSPPRVPAGHPLSPTRCCERIGVSSAAPHAAAPFERQWCLACRAGLGLRSHASREGERFPKNQEAFHRVVVLCVREDRSPRRFGFGLRVTPPGSALARSPVFSSSEWHCSEEYQRLCVRPSCA